MTIDPVSTANPGWKPFLLAYNEWCSDRHGVPLLNQTFGVTAAIAKKAFGDRLKRIATTRKKYDPTNRLLNDTSKSCSAPETIVLRQNLIAGPAG